MSSDPSITELLRERLHQDARLLHLPERRPERAAARARARRRHRRAGLVGAAVVLVGAAALLPALRGSGSRQGDVSTDGAMLTPTGPLALDWQRYDGGPGEPSWTTIQDDQGVIYALSTAPGSGAAASEDRRPTLYRLGDDGTWQSLVLDADAGGAPQAIDVSGADGLLYAVSTGPGSGTGSGDAVAAQLSSSADGGTTWTTEDLPTVAPPSETIEWHQNQTLAVESSGATTLALVTTTFEPAATEDLFPELGTGSQGSVLVVETRDEGLALVRYEGSAAANPSVMVDPSGDAQEATVPTFGGTGGEGEVVRTIPWSELGVDGGIGALTPPSEIFRSGEDGWEPLDDADGSFADLTVAGGRFVLLTAPTGPTSGSVVRASEDGSTWSDVELPAPGRVVGTNDVLVDVPDDFDGVVHASADGGLTWEPVDLADAGIGPDHEVYALDGGPLGLALVTSTEGGEEQLTVSGDLVDWTTTPLSDVTGLDDDVMASVFVGADRIVVRATPFGDGDESTPPPGTVTAVATPARNG